MASLFVAAFESYYLLGCGNDFLSRFLNTLLNDKRDHIPTLFIYSKTDDLVSAENIEKFIEKRKKLFPTLKIKSMAFDKAEHVMIYQKYQEQYLKLIKEHLALCGLLNSRDDEFNCKLNSKL